MSFPEGIGELHRDVEGYPCAKIFETQEGKVGPVNVKDCMGCECCVEVCKEKAISVEELEAEMSEIARLLYKDILQCA